MEYVRAERGVQCVEQRRWRCVGVQHGRWCNSFRKHEAVGVRDAKMGTLPGSPPTAATRSPATSDNLKSAAAPQAPEECTVRTRAEHEVFSSVHLTLASASSREAAPEAELADISFHTVRACAQPQTKAREQVRREPARHSSMRKQHYASNAACLKSY